MHKVETDKKSLNQNVPSLSMLKFGRRLRAKRIATGIDDSHVFAAMLSLEVADYECFERGKVLPDIDTLVMIAKLTDCPLDFFLSGRGRAYAW